MLTTINTLEIKQAVAILRAGGLVALPTETVYGLGADAKQAAAVRKIFAAKERPYDHPLIVHLASVDDLEAWAAAVSPQARRLAAAFWPGPLTMVFNKQPTVLDIVTGNQPTVGIRVPAHPVAQALLRAFGGGIVAPSANKFTHVSPTTAFAVREELGGAVDLILDGGACAVGLESTIVDMSGSVPMVLRPGMITATALSEVLGEPVMMRDEAKVHTRVPGMHHLHYAPITMVQLVATTDLADYLQTLSQDRLPIAVVVHSKPDWPAQSGVKYVVMSSQASEYAHDLYHTLRSLDREQMKQIIIERVPMSVEWEAIRDRLKRAVGEGR